MSMRSRAPFYWQDNQIDGPKRFARKLGSQIAKEVPTLQETGSKGDSDLLGNLTQAEQRRLLKVIWIIETRDYGVW